MARSQFNNTLWIKYLCEAEEGDNTRLKEFFYQPDINQLRSNQNLKKMIRDFGDTLDERFKGEETITKLNRGSKEIRKILKRENLGESPKSIAELAKQDPPVKITGLESKSVSSIYPVCPEFPACC